MDKRDNLVSDSLDGAVVVGNGQLKRLDHNAPTPVAVRTNLNPHHVALVSGGGAGHEPSHAGFVGEGLLSAAVCGDIFASPSVDAVLTGILAATGEAGCLLIIMNYTGDRLNFGLAAERARDMGHEVEMVVVGDDIALPDSSKRRGVAGTLFVHKIAGHLAERGADLEEVAQAARSVADRVVSLGVARDSGSVPGNKKVDRIHADDVEVGVGIHGEPGVETKKNDTLSGLVSGIAEKLRAALPEEGPIALLINNLGGTSELEMSAVTAAVARTSLAPRIELLMGPASVMTSTDMPGFSLTALPLTDADREALEAPTSVRSWPSARALTQPRDQVVPSPELPPSALDTAKASGNDTVRALISEAAQCCIDNASDLNDLDAKVGDGDTGSTFAGAARWVLDLVDDLPLDDPEELCRALSALMSEKMGGSSGVLFALFFERAANAFPDNNWPDALAAGLNGMMELGGAHVGDRTMIDALSPAIEALQRGDDLGAAARAAREGADSTGEMGAAQAGRSSYLSRDSLQGVVDPGAEGVTRVLERLAEAMG